MVLNREWFGRFRPVMLSALSIAATLLLPRVVSAQYYFTGPYGPNGTWNLYEFVGFPGEIRTSGLDRRNTWLGAHEDAITRTEPITGATVVGHLVSFSGTSATAENAFVAEKTMRDSVWIGLTDNEEFGGNEAGDDGTLGLGHPPADGIGWKWTSGEIFDYANWANTFPRDSLGDLVNLDATSLNSNVNRWFSDAIDQRAQAYVIEYETRQPTDFPVPAVRQPEFLPGPAPQAGVFAIREVTNSGIQIGHIHDVVGVLNGVSPQAIVYDYHYPVIDFRDGIVPAPSERDFFRHNRPFEVFSRNPTSQELTDDFAFVAHAQILIPEGQGGDWTFQVAYDDAFELLIRGAAFHSTTGSAPGARHAISPYGSFIQPSVGFETLALATVNLAPGVHDLELLLSDFSFIGGIELSAARGVKAAVDDDFALVGAPPIDVQGTTPVIQQPTGTFLERRTPDSAGPINSLTAARRAFAAPQPGDLEGPSPFAVNVQSDNAAYVVALGRYERNLNGTIVSSTNTALKSNATLHVDTPGIYTFGIELSDGGELTITGAQFVQSIGEATITNAGQSLSLESSDHMSLSLAMVELEPGDYPLEFITFNHLDVMSAELFVAPGSVDFFDRNAFALLSTVPTTIDYHRPAGIALVPEPSAMALSLFGSLAAIVATCRLRHMWRFRPEKLPIV